MLYAFFWVIPRRMTPGNYPEESIQHSEHGESLKSSIHVLRKAPHLHSENIKIHNLLFPIQE